MSTVFTVLGLWALAEAALWLIRLHVCVHEDRQGRYIGRAK